MVNTFLPYPDYEKSAKVLDYRRLGKQRVEAYQLINILENKNPEKKGWNNHPALLMWKGHTDALKLYFNVMVKEWISRGYKNTMKIYDIDYDKVVYPWWFGWMPFHYSHQASLLRKDWKHYTQYFTILPLINVMHGYIWPSKLPKDVNINSKVKKEYFAKI